MNALLRRSLLAWLAACALPACDTAADGADGDAGDGDGDGDGDTVDFIDLRVEDIGPRRAVVRWTTSTDTTCLVDFGTAPDALESEATDPDMEPGTFADTHRVPLEDLLPDTTYHLRARVETPDGNLYLSEPLSFGTMTEDTEDELENVALVSAGTTVTDVSSNFGGAGNDDSWGAHAALDGMMTSAWATSGDGDDAYMVLDLGQARDLVRFGFRSREMNDGTSIIESVQLSFDGGPMIGPFDTPDPSELYEFDLDPVSATVVRLDAVTTSGGNTGALEFQLFEAAE